MLFIQHRQRPRLCRNGNLGRRGFSGFAVGLDGAVFGVDGLLFQYIADAWGDVEDGFGVVDQVNGTRGLGTDAQQYIGVLRFDINRNEVFRDAVEFQFAVLGTQRTDGDQLIHADAREGGITAEGGTRFQRQFVAHRFNVDGSRFINVERGGTADQVQFAHFLQVQVGIVDVELRIAHLLQAGRAEFKVEFQIGVEIPGLQVAVREGDVGVGIPGVEVDVPELVLNLQRIVRRHIHRVVNLQVVAGVDHLADGGNHIFPESGAVVVEHRAGTDEPCRGNHLTVDGREDLNHLGGLFRLGRQADLDPHRILFPMDHIHIAVFVGNLHDGAGLYPETFALLALFRIGLRLQHLRYADCHHQNYHDWQNASFAFHNSIVIIRNKL